MEIINHERLVEMLRESADVIENEDLPHLAVAPPRLREAASRIEKAAKVARKIKLRPSLAAKILRILNGDARS